VVGEQVPGDELGQLLPRRLRAHQRSDDLVASGGEEVALHRQRRFVVVVDDQPLGGLDPVQPEPVPELPRHRGDHQGVGWGGARRRIPLRRLVEGRERVVVLDPRAHARRVSDNVLDMVTSAASGCHRRRG
jgi:hypothetical protein